MKTEELTFLNDTLITFFVVIKMGNTNSCCAWRGSSRNSSSEGKTSWTKNGRAGGGDGEDCSRHDPAGGGESLDREESGANLQHISEREPDDFNKDPSVHPSAQTLFIEKSKRAIQSKFRLLIM